jgi:hypothetical protein
MAHRAPLSRGSAGFRFYVFAINVLGREPERTGLCHSNGRGAVTGTLAQVGRIEEQVKVIAGPRNQNSRVFAIVYGAIGPAFYC